MISEKIVKIIEKMALPIVHDAGMELVEVNYVKEGSRWYLRIFIDKPGGVCIEDCRFISEKIDKLIDEKDPIPQSYILEVSSPGIERLLKNRSDYNRFAGRLATVATFAPLHGKKLFEGKIKGIRGDDVVMEINGSELLVPFEKIASARLKIEF